VGEIVNLRRARKGKQRLRKETEAAANRLAFGLAKSTKQKLDAEGDLAERRLDSHRLAPQNDDK
jgi:hypothetical protein